MPYKVELPEYGEQLLFTSQELALLHRLLEQMSGEDAKKFLSEEFYKFCETLFSNRNFFWEFFDELDRFMIQEQIPTLEGLCRNS